jgi:F-type H+-transporting ATPase subunit b
MRRFVLSAFALLAVAAVAVAVPAFADVEQQETEVAHEESTGAHGGTALEPQHEQPFNWADGFLGEKDGVEPSVLWRPKGTPPPFLANIINAGILVWILVAAGKKPVAEALKQRKSRLIGAMEEAGRMKAEAQVTLTQYEERLRHLDDEIERIRREMREAALSEQQRVLTEAKERRTRMERDAALLVEQERKGAREILIRETVTGALKSAEQILVKHLGEADKDRLASDFLATVRTTHITSKGVAS